jgi:hypothetical protein
LRIESFVLAVAVLATSIIGAATATPARADDPIVILLKDHKFQPLNPVIPANIEVMVTVKNLDATPAEFESDDFTVEKVVPPNGQITVKIGPLKPGSYEIHDEFHEDQSKTHLTVQ